MNAVSRLTLLVVANHCVEDSGYYGICTESVQNVCRVNLRCQFAGQKLGALLG